MNYNFLNRSPRVKEPDPKPEPMQFSHLRIDGHHLVNFLSRPAKKFCLRCGDPEELLDKVCEGELKYSPTIGGGR